MLCPRKPDAQPVGPGCWELLGAAGSGPCSQPVAADSWPGGLGAVPGKKKKECSPECRDAPAARPIHLQRSPILPNHPKRGPGPPAARCLRENRFNQALLLRSSQHQSLRSKKQGRQTAPLCGVEGGARVTQSHSSDGDLAGAAKLEGGPVRRPPSKQRLILCESLSYPCYLS